MENDSYANEIWKDIVGFEGEYQVSNCGRVRSVDRIGTHVNYKGKTVKVPYKGRVLRPGDSRGYLSVLLNSKPIKVHRLVASTFIENPDNLPVVNHIDGNKKNNNVKNLEWVTQKQNIKHAKDHGLMPDKKSSISRYDIHKARMIYVPGKNSKTNSNKLAEQYGVSRSYMYRILSGEKCKLEDFDISSIDDNNICKCKKCGNVIFELYDDSYIEHLPMRCDKCGFEFEINTPVLHKAILIK